MKPSFTFSAMALIATSLMMNSASAAVVNQSVKWPADSNGVTTIPVCIIEGSDSAQRGYGRYYGYIHAANPSLDEVIRHVRTVLRNTWGQYSSVEFTDWANCDRVTDRDQHVGLYINSDADNKAFIGTAAKGKTTKDDRGVQFKPFGNDFNSCVTYSWSTTHMEYSFDCVEQYAIHEFGHALGFEHEWRNPSKPSSCKNRDGELPLNVNETSSYYLTAGFDKNSIMVYDDDCAEVQGVRFGTTRLSSRDVEAVNAVYSTPQWMLTRKAQLQTAAGFLVTAILGGGIDSRYTDIAPFRTLMPSGFGGAWEQFDLVPVFSAGANKYGLRTAFGTYVTAESGGGMLGRTALRSQVSPVLGWETFEMIRQQGDKVAFRTPNGVNLLTAENGGGTVDASSMSTNRTQVGNWETFTLLYKPASHLVVDLSGRVYAVQQGKRRGIPNPETFLALGFRWEEITSDPVLNGIPQGDDYPVVTGSVIRNVVNGAVYMLEQGTRRWVPDMDTFTKLGLTWGSVTNYPAGTIERIPEGPAMPKM